MIGRRLVLGMAALALLTAAPPAPAQMFVTTGRDTLRSLPGVEVIVDAVPPELERAGLSATALKGGLEKRLRSAGITVYASQKDNPSQAKPYLYVHLNALDVPGRDLCIVAVLVQLRQTVRSVVTSSNIVDAMTWDSHTVIGLPVKELRRVSDEIDEHADRFIADWKATRGPA
jgi:hypothetical protein